MKRLLIVVIFLMLTPLPAIIQAEEGRPAGKIPPEMSFLKKLPAIAMNDCVETATGATALCVVLIDLENGIWYLTIWQKNILRAVIKIWPDGKTETIYEQMRL